MRRLRYAVAMSLDGYIAGPAGEADWILMDPDIDFESMMAEFDTLVMGRHTFGVAGGTSGGGSSGGMKTVVVSRTLSQDRHPRVRVVSDDVQQAINELKGESGKDIWLFGGGNLFRSLLALRVVDTVEVAIIPVLLGGGIPLLPAPAERVRLSLTQHRIYPKTGTVALAYNVEYAQARRRRKKP